MTDETKKVVSIDGTDYSPEDLSEDSINYINQLQSINQRKVSLRMDYEQLEAAESVFMEKLKTSLPSDSETKEVKAGGAN